MMPTNKFAALLAAAPHRLHLRRLHLTPPPFPGAKRCSACSTSSELAGGMGPLVRQGWFGVARKAPAGNPSAARACHLPSCQHAMPLFCCTVSADLALPTLPTLPPPNQLLFCS